MNGYSAFAQFYEAITEDPSERVSHVRRCLSTYAPAARSALDLGCGTGLVLSELPELSRRVGVDVSEEMLAVARDRDPGVDWRLGDMVELRLEQTFDVVLCMYDTVNHLPERAAWHRLFRQVHAHLNEHGVFLFDVNTVTRLEQLGRMPPWVHDFSSNVSIMDVSCESDGNQVRSRWNIRIFAPTGGEDGAFQLHATTVHELGVPLEQILSETDPLFDVLELTDPHGLPATDDSSRAYFAVRRR